STDFGDDTIGLSLAAGYDYVDGGWGVDTLDYSATTQGVFVDLASGTATGVEIGNDEIYNIENITGGSGNDTLSLGIINGTMAGGAGDDTYNIDTTVYPYQPDFGAAYSYQTIVDVEGNNILNIVIPDGGYISYGVDANSTMGLNVHF